uniref:EKA-like protein n=1 Tax=Strongyloides stercoralis TaxID=6248 RepID=A0A0K0ET84_STRER
MVLFCILYNVILTCSNVNKGVLKKNVKDTGSKFSVGRKDNSSKKSEGKILREKSKKKMMKLSPDKWDDEGNDKDTQSRSKSSTKKKKDLSNDDVIIKPIKQEVPETVVSPKNVSKNDKPIARSEDSIVINGADYSGMKDKKITKEVNNFDAILNILIE